MAARHRAAASHAALHGELADAQAARQAVLNPELDPSFVLLTRAVEHMDTHGEAGD